MPTFTLADVEKAVRDSWTLETTSLDDEGRAAWTPERPAVGQCGPTALVVQDLLGGDLVYGRLSGGGQAEEHHYWNRLAGGIEVDLTREQITPGRVLSDSRVVTRPPGGPRAHVEAYQLMRARVFAALDQPLAVAESD